MDLSSPGMGSGLDIKAIVSTSVLSDLKPLQDRHDKKLNSVNTEISAIGQLKNALSNLQTTLSSLSNISQFYKMKNSLSESGYFSAAVTDQAKAGVYQIQVEKLAQSQSLASHYFANTDALGSGTITINFGTYTNDLSGFTVNPDTSAVHITIEPGHDSLTAVCDAINASDSKITASIVQDSTGSRISLSSSQTGVNYAMQITGDLPDLIYDPTTNNTALTETMAAQNSLIQLNGMSITQSSNQLNNLLTGISLSLKQADTGKTIKLTVENNQDQLTGSINDFIKKYNDCMSLLNNLTGYNRDTKQSGFYQGDAQIKNLKFNLYQAITTFTSTSSDSIHSLADLGINTYVGKDSFKHGLLEIDQDKFNNAVNENYSSIGALFAKTIRATDPNIQVNTLDTQAQAGIYNLVLDEYTPSVSMSGTLGGLPATSQDGVILNGSGNLKSLSLKVLGGGIGDRGEISVTDGLASLLSTTLDTYMGKEGELTRRSESLNNKVTQLTKEQEQINARGTVLEKRYMKQWNKVDLFLTQLNDTSAMLTKVLDNLPKFKTK